MFDRKLISIVVPAMNEEENVSRFYDAALPVMDALSGYDWELIFVDDGSTDRTVDEVLRLRESDERVRLLQLSRNFGSYAAIRAGFEHARGDAVISISCDLQDDPSLFHDFVERWEEGYHTVWGVRARRDDSWSKTFLAKSFYRVVRGLALADLPTGGMDCGLFDRQVISEFLRIPDKHAITFMTIYWMGYKQARIPYHRKDRTHGESKWPLGKRIKAAVDVLTSFSYLPVRAASYVGIVISAISILSAGVILFNRVVLGIGSLGWPSIMVTVLFLAGVQLTVLGVLGEYIWRIASEVRGRPQHIVMERYGFDDVNVLEVQTR